MTVRSEQREQVRKRAGYACEFCGVREVDAGSRLTVDHFQPTSKGGGDQLENLVYCCACCNSYKLDYWPAEAESPGLWNPRQENFEKHFVLLDDGTLHALTPRGALTIDRLRLNRSPLVLYRLEKRRDQERRQLLKRYKDLNMALEKLLEHQSDLAERAWNLVGEQRELLLRLIDDYPRD